VTLGQALHRLSGFSTDPEAIRSYARRSIAIFESLPAVPPDRTDPNAHGLALD
jgi:hypothetical protein